MSSYNKCIYISIGFLVFGFGLFLFSTLTMKAIIADGAMSRAQLKEENSDLWAYLPGKSKVQIFKEHYFYNVENLEEIFYSNQRPKATEKGPYLVREYNEFINRTYSKDDSTVYFKYWKYHNISEEDQKKEEDLITTINLPSLAYWYQAKNASPSKIALKALYTVYQTLISDFYYGAIQQGVQTFYNNSTIFFDLFENNTYFDDNFKNLLAYDNNYGVYGNNNAFFIKAVMTHPSPDSKFLMDYWGLAEVEMEYFKNVFDLIKDLELNSDTQVDLAVKQWLDLSVIDGESIASRNKTSKGYPEYGAFLKFVLKTGKSSLNYEQARALFFDFNDVGRNPRIDDSSSLINKVNLEKIFQFKNEKDAIKFIDTQMKISNLTESELIYKYVLYANGELTFRYSAGGTKGIGALSDILSQALFKIFNTMGNDLFYGMLSNQLFKEYFSLQSCNDALNKIKLPSKFIIDSICSDDNLITDKFENMKIWINGILYQDPKFLKVLNNTQNGKLNEYDILELTQRNSNIVKFFENYVDTIFREYDISGNYLANNLMNLASYQWVYSKLTNSDYNVNSADSVIGWNPSHYKKAPEYSEYCKQFGYEINIDYQSIKEVANFDNMFSSKWIADAFINYYKNDSSSPFYSKQFINYLRYIFLNEVLNIFTTRPVKELLWGYEDDLLKYSKNKNYFLGGDPTISTTFSLLNNKSTPPDDDNVWSMDTGVLNYTKTRDYKTMSGYKNSSIVY